MLSSSYLASCSDELVELYSNLEADIITDMARRLKKLGKVTDSTLYQAKIMQELGGIKAEVNKYLSKSVQKKLKQMLKMAL